MNTVSDGSQVDMNHHLWSTPTQASGPTAKSSRLPGDLSNVWKRVRAALFCYILRVEHASKLWVRVKLQNEARIMLRSGYRAGYMSKMVRNRLLMG